MKVSIDSLKPGIIDSFNDEFHRTILESLNKVILTVKRIG